MSPEAQERYYIYAKEVETWLRPGGRFEQMKKWGNKFTGATVRLAGVFHVAINCHSKPWKKPISADTLEMAIRFMDVVADHSAASFDLMSENEVMERARKIWEWMIKTGKTKFTNRDIQQSMKSRYKTWKIIKEGVDMVSV